MQTERTDSKGWPQISPMINVNDAPDYLNVDVRQFNDDIKPHLRIMKMGRNGRFYKRVELDNWKKALEREAKKGVIKWS